MDIWSAALGAVTVVGLVVGVWQTLRAEQLNRHARDYDWPRIQNAARGIAGSIRRASFEPDLILALSDRGGIIAYLINQELPKRVPVLVAGYVGGYVDSAFKKWTFTGFTTVVGQDFLVLLPDGLKSLVETRVLLVDDFVRTGDTYTAVKHYLVNAGFVVERIRTASIATTRVASVSGKGPDFFDREVESIKFSFPWAPAE